MLSRFELLVSQLRLTTTQEVGSHRVTLFHRAGIGGSQERSHSSNTPNQEVEELVSSGPRGSRPGTLNSAPNHQASPKATEVALQARNLGALLPPRLRGWLPPGPLPGSHLANSL